MIICENFVTVFILLCNFFLENVEKNHSQGFREGRSGYSKHNFFPPHAWKKVSLRTQTKQLENAPDYFYKD